MSKRRRFAGLRTGRCFLSIPVLLLSVFLGGRAFPAPGPQGRDSAAGSVPKNIYGAHLLVDSLEGSGEAQLLWVKKLVGRRGHVKTLFMNVTADTDGPRPGWVAFLNRCYDEELIPVVRLAGVYREGGWVKPEADAPGDYHSMAAAVKRVVEGLPRRDGFPLYVEIWNEPNLSVEWSGEPNAAEYAAFFVQAAAALREIGDPRIVILNGALATSAGFTEELCRAEPAFVDSFDVWASHPYPMNHPPEVNIHDGTAGDSPEHTIDSYLLELEVLEKHGRADVPVMITETGYDLGNDVFRGEGHPIIDEANRADYIARAFRDFWSQWDEIVAVLPFVFMGENWERFEWVYPDSGTDQDGFPTRPHRQYTAVAALAKPTDSTGAVSGRVILDPLGVPVENVWVRGGIQGPVVSYDINMTDALGAFYLGGLQPGRCVITFSGDGLAGGRTEVRIEAGRNAVVEMPMRALALGTLHGVVRDALGGQGVFGVSVRFDPPVEGEIVTDPRGRFRGVRLQPVAYTIELSRPGYRTLRVPGIVVPGRGEREIRLAIAPRCEPPWPNLLGNPGFEEGVGGGGRQGIGLRFEPTATGEYEVVPGAAFSGLRGQLIRAGDREVVVRQITHYGTAKVGARYAASVWCRADSLSGEGAALSMDFTRDSGEVVERVGPTERVRGSTGKWRRLRLEGTAPEGARRISVNLMVGKGKGTACFDDVYLGVEPGAGENGAH